MSMTISLASGPSVGYREHRTLPKETHVTQIAAAPLQPAAENRRLFEKAEFYGALATEDRTGFHYCVTKNLSSAPC